jgi:hypothetical protein
MEEQKALCEGPVTSVFMRMEFEVGLRVQSTAEASANRIRGKLLVVLQVSCRGVCNMALEFWKLVEFSR